MCPRKSLDEDTVLYLTQDCERIPYIVYIDNSGRFLIDPCSEKQTTWSKNSNSFPSNNISPLVMNNNIQYDSLESDNSNYNLLSTGSDGWIFVIYLRMLNVRNLFQGKYFRHWYYMYVIYFYQLIFIILY